MDQAMLEQLAAEGQRKRREGGEDRKLGELDLLRKQVAQAKQERSRLLQGQTSRLRLTTVGSKVMAQRSKLLLQMAAPEDEDVLTRQKLAKLGEQLASFRLAGVSAFSVGGRPLDIGLRFDSTFAGQIMDDKYYVILTSDSNLSLSVYRHSLPHFVPVIELAKVFLPNDPAQFARRVSRYVCALAQRRILAGRMEKEFDGEAKLTNCSQAFDIITLQGRLLDGKVHSIQLKFATVLDVLPNQAVVTYLKKDGRAQISEVKLDRVVEPSIVLMDQYLDYSLWVRNVLQHEVAPSNDNDEEEE
ncbi:hypothetical protein BASA81_005407 [Batrachochytrium salamandrivorans]|nr:hypothetical protein BASA81_005407 [Batrachochytrium salamandrivorans]